MTVSTRTSRILIALIAVSAAVAAACSSGDPEPSATPTGPSGGPVSFPYIFAGNFTVAGQAGPQGIPMFARLGEGRGPFNNTVRPGEYTNVSIAPRAPGDVGGEITFYLGHPDESNVRAEETFVFDPITQPRFVQLDLTFSRLP